MFLNFILCHSIHADAGIVLSLFLIFGNFEPRCSYKIVLIKKILFMIQINGLAATSFKVRIFEEKHVFQEKSRGYSHEI